MLKALAITLLTASFLASGISFSPAKTEKLPSPGLNRTDILVREALTPATGTLEPAILEIQR